MSQTDPTTAITETPISPEVAAEANTLQDDLSGFAPDTVVTSPEGQSERIVYDTDEAGNVLGWHKETVSG